MDAAIKSKWIKALLSGKYKQAKGRLRNRRGGHCCLGVLCDIVQPDKWVRFQVTDRTYVWEHDNSSGLPTSEVLAAVGLHLSIAGKFADMNDEGASFKMIARRIKADA